MKPRSHSGRLSFGYCEPWRRDGCDYIIGRVNALDQMVSEVGLPTLLRSVRQDGDESPMVARWQYEHAEVTAEPTNAFRFVVNLVDGQRSLDGWQVGANQAVAAGSMALLPPDARVRLSMPTRGDALHILLPVRSDRSLDGVAMAPRFGVRDRAMRMPALQIMVGSIRNGPDDAILVGEAMARLYAACEGEAGRVLDARRPDHLAPGPRRRVAELIDAHLANNGPDQQPLSVAALAAAARLSVNHFIRSFNADWGETPHQHLIRRRMERAMGHLASQSYSVGEVCDLAGFASTAHFVAVFRKHTGVTPGAFRDALRR